MRSVGFQEEEATDAEFIEIGGPERFGGCAVIEGHAANDDGAADFGAVQIPGHHHIHAGRGDRVAEALVDITRLVVRTEADAFHLPGAEDGAVGTVAHEEGLVLRDGGGEGEGIGGRLLADGDVAVELCLHAIGQRAVGPEAAAVGDAERGLNSMS